MYKHIIMPALTTLLCSYTFADFSSVESHSQLETSTAKNILKLCQQYDALLPQPASLPTPIQTVTPEPTATTVLSDEVIKEEQPITEPSTNTEPAKNTPEQNITEEKSPQDETVGGNTRGDAWIHELSFLKLEGESRDFMFFMMEYANLPNVIKHHYRDTTYKELAYEGIDGIQLSDKAIDFYHNKLGLSYYAIYTNLLKFPRYNKIPDSLKNADDIIFEDFKKLTNFNKKKTIEYLPQKPSINFQKGIPNLTNNEKQLHDFCINLRDSYNNKTISIAELQEALISVAGEEIQSITNMLVNISEQHISDISKRMRMHHQKNKQSGMVISLNGQNLTGGNAGQHAQKFGVYSTISTDITEKDSSRIEKSYEHDETQITVGGDYLLNSQWLVGSAISIANAKMQYENHRAKHNTDSLSIGFYASYSHPLFYIDSSIHYSKHEYDGFRKIIIPSIGVNELANSSTNASAYSYAITIGSDYFLHNINLDYYARLQGIQNTVDAYKEKDSFLALSYDEYKVKSLQLILGMQASKAYSFSQGVFAPYFASNLHHETETDKNKIVSQFVYGRFNNKFSIDSNNYDSSYISASLGFNLVLVNNLQLFSEIEHRAGLEKYKSTTFSIGGRLDF